MKYILVWEVKLKLRCISIKSTHISAWVWLYWYIFTWLSKHSEKKRIKTQTISPRFNSNSISYIKNCEIRTTIESVKKTPNCSYWNLSWYEKLLSIPLHSAFIRLKHSTNFHNTFGKMWRRRIAEWNEDNK